MAVMLSSVCVLDTSILRKTPTPKAENSAAVVLAGEFRTVAANLLWIKAEKYHHEFIEHGGTWNQNKDMMPLIGLIVDLDPHFVEAYLTGSWMLCTGMNKPKQALDFLKEGQLNNPNSPEIYEELAILYARKFDNPEKSYWCAKKALSLTRDDFDRQRIARLTKTIKGLCDEKARFKGQQTASSKTQ